MDWIDQKERLDREYKETTSIHRGVYVDESLETLYKIRCESCAKPLYELRAKVLLTQQVEDRSLEEVYDMFDVRMCCRAALETDEIIPAIPFNPEVEAGRMTPQEARRRQLQAETSVEKNWHGHMKRTDYRLKREGNVYYAIDPKTNEKVMSYEIEPPFTVVEWLEVPMPELAQKMFASKETKSILQPRLASITTWHARSKEHWLWKKEQRPKETDPLFAKLQIHEETGFESFESTDKQYKK